MSTSKIIGQRIKECRLQKGLTQKQTAEQLGIVLQQYQTYESGRYELCYDKMIKLCGILDVSADYLLGLSDEY